MSAACWTCGQAASAPPAATLASAATPSARTGWMDVDARIAAMRIGPKHGRSGSEAAAPPQAKDADGERPTPLAERDARPTGPYWSLDVPPADMLPDAERWRRPVYLEFFAKLRALLTAPRDAHGYLDAAKRNPNLVAHGLSEVQLFYAMLTALRVGDRDNFNVAVHLETVEAMRVAVVTTSSAWGLGYLGQFDDEDMFWREAPFEQTIDYYELCLPNATNLLWVEAEREIHPKEWALALSEGAQVELSRIMVLFQHIYWGNRWFEKLIRAGTPAKQVFDLATKAALHPQMHWLLALRDDRIRIDTLGQHHIVRAQGRPYGRTSKTALLVDIGIAESVINLGGRMLRLAVVERSNWHTLAQRFPASPLRQLPKAVLGEVPAADPALLSAWRQQEAEAKALWAQAEAAKRRSDASATEIRQASRWASATSAASATTPTPTGWEDLPIGPKRERAPDAVGRPKQAAASSSSDTPLAASATDDDSSSSSSSSSSAAQPRQFFWPFQQTLLVALIQFVYEEFFRPQGYKLIASGLDTDKAAAINAVVYVVSFVLRLLGRSADASDLIDPRFERDMQRMIASMLAGRDYAARAHELAQAAGVLGLRQIAFAAAGPGASMLSDGAVGAVEAYIQAHCRAYLRDAIVAGVNEHLDLATMIVRLYERGDAAVRRSVDSFGLASELRGLVSRNERITPGTAPRRSTMLAVAIAAIVMDASDKASLTDWAPGREPLRIRPIDWDSVLAPPPPPPQAQF